MSTTDLLNPATPGRLKAPATPLGGGERSETGGTFMPPSSLPDAAVLARLANEFFAALPGRSAAGGVPVPANPQPAGTSLPPGTTGPSTPAALPFGAVSPGANLVPTSPQSPANAGASLPALVPHAQAPNGVPDHALTAVPGVDGRAGSHVLSVPQAQAAAAAPTDDRLIARSFGLPGEDALRALLGDIPKSPVQVTAPAASAPSYYFVEANTPQQVAPSAHPLFDVNAVRRDFPILQERVNGRPLVWFDNAATTQKPQAVIDRLSHFYAHENSNIHRAAHELAARATDAYEGARETVRRFIGASSTEEIVFVRGTTEAINLVAKSWGAANIGPGDEIIVSHLEHHANIVPWQLVAGQTGAIVKAVPMDRRGVIDVATVAAHMNERTRIVACAHVSNALGTVLPVREITRLAHARGAVVLIDGAQAVPHQRVDLKALDCDFYAFSAHKMYGPTGIGALIGRESLLEAMPPWQGGGDMILTVSFEKTTFNELPFKFEAGTPNISGAVGMAAAIDYIDSIGIDNIHAHEQRLLALATRRLESVPGLTIIGTAPDKAAVISFTIDGIHPHDLGTILDAEGVAVRTGHHCAMPVMEFFNVPATARASFACYSRESDIDALAAALAKAREVFS